MTIMSFIQVSVLSMSARAKRYPRPLCLEFPLRMIGDLSNFDGVLDLCCDWLAEDRCILDSDVQYQRFYQEEMDQIIAISWKIKA